jgi:hypothetical protein
MCMFCSLLDEHLLHAYITDLASTEYRAQFLLAFHDLVLMHRDVIELVTTCTMCDAEARNQLLLNASAIKQTILLLGVNFQGVL